MASRKKFIINYTIEQMEEMLQSKEDFKVAIRLMTSILVAKGFSLHEIQKVIYTKTPANYIHWAIRFNEEGLKGLSDREGRGRKSKLSEADFKELKDILVNKTPGQFGYNSHTWNVEIITDLIKQKYGISYKTTNTYIILKKKLNLVPRKTFGVQAFKGL